MQATTSADTERFAFLSDALNGCGRFAPRVSYAVDASGMSRPSSVATACALVPYPRESAMKYAARVAATVYENHLRAACERFVGYIARRSPVRDGLQNPLIGAIAEDADWAGNAIDVFWHGFMIEAKARGCMLLLVELPAVQPLTQAEAVDLRLVPYLTAIEPERVTGYELDERKRFAWVKIASRGYVAGKMTNVERYWDASVWRVMVGERVVEEGAHPFGECPMLAFTEGGCYPHVGSFAQIADLSCRLYNARSEKTEILRAQTFSLLTYQVPAESRSTFNAAEVAATIGTHNMLVHEGDAPTFIAPSDGPATVYADDIAALEDAIRRIGFSTDIDGAKTAADASGLALTIRFQALNGALSAFAQRMHDLEARMWALVARHLGISAAPTAAWATDYSLADVERELNILTAMQATGFAEEALTAQRLRIAGEAFDSLDEAARDEVLAAIRQRTHERRTTT